MKIWNYEKFIPYAEAMLCEAETCNPGPWKSHSRYVAEAARMIAERCEGMDGDKAYCCGLLHDIGRKFGVGHLAHVYNGYHYLMDQGLEEFARIALTHSFQNGSLEDYIGKFDISVEQQQELERLIKGITFDDYDLLIQLCDALATAEGIVSLEERMNDVKSRYGQYPQKKWDRNMKLKRLFEEKAGCTLQQIFHRNI